MTRKDRQPARIDYEYKWEGQCALFLAVEPLVGFREMWVSDQRWKVDFANALRDLVDINYHDADCVVLLCENLSIYHAAAL